MLVRVVKNWNWHADIEYIKFAYKKLQKFRE